MDSFIARGAVHHGNREQIIAEVISDLERFRHDPSCFEQDALVELDRFFRAIRKFPDYLRWLFRRAPKLARHQLLELTDLSLPRWERVMHTQLIAMERRRFPGLVAPLVERITAFIVRRNRPLVLASLGCGGMEVEHQVMKRLIARQHRQPVVFVGLDASATAHQIARENLLDVEPFISVFEYEHLDKTQFGNIVRAAKPLSVVLCRNEVSRLSEDFGEKAFDLVFHSLFQHHLSESQRALVDAEVARATKKSLEYDGYRSWSVMVPQTAMLWQQPILLNATIFSDLRYLAKREVGERSRGGAASFFRIGTYLLERSY